MEILTELKHTYTEVILRYDAKDIKSEILYNKYTKKDDTYINYISESHPSKKNMVHVVPGKWKIDTINKNIVKLIELM